MSESKIIEKKIARIVKSELDKSNYEDTAWLKAFKEAGGDKNQARAIYVGVRSKDLEDEFYEEQSRIEQEKIDKENKIEQEKEDRENRLEQLRLKKDELKNRRNVRERERSAYSYSKITANNDSFLESNIKPFIRGEFSLPFSYWYIGFLCSIIVNLPLFVIEVQKVEPEGIGALFYFLYALVVLIYTICVNLGIWRSAGFYVIEKNKKKENGFWGYAARLTVILAYIRLIAEFIKEFSK
jgi:hypothetical protein